MTIPDYVTQAKADRVLRRARTLGLDGINELDTAGLLLTPAARHKIALDALDEFHTSILRWQPHEFLRRLHKDTPSTPAEMYEAILSYVEEYIEEERKK